MLLFLHLALISLHLDLIFKLIFIKPFMLYLDTTKTVKRKEGNATKTTCLMYNIHTMLPNNPLSTLHLLHRWDVVVVHTPVVAGHNSHHPVEDILVGNPVEDTVGTLVVGNDGHLPSLYLGSETNRPGQQGPGNIRTDHYLTNWVVLPLEVGIL